MLCYLAFFFFFSIVLSSLLVLSGHISAMKCIMAAMWNPRDPDFELRHDVSFREKILKRGAILIPHLCGPWGKIVVIQSPSCDLGIQTD